MKAASWGDIGTPTSGGKLEVPAAGGVCGGQAKVRQPRKISIRLGQQAWSLGPPYQKGVELPGVPFLPHRIESYIFKCVSSTQKELALRKQHNE